MKNLVDAQAVKEQALNYINNFLVQNGYGPSMRDIQTGLNLGSVSTVRTLLTRMRADGMIDYDDRLARSIRVPWND